jgi:MFS family permease
MHMMTEQTTQRAAPTPLAIPNFRLLWIGQTLFSLAVQFYIVALVWLVLQLTGSGVALGAVLTVAAVPRAVTMLFSGIIADRVEPRVLLALSALGSATLVGVIAFLLSIDGMALWALYIIAALLGLMDAFFYPTALAQVPRLVAPEKLAQGNAIIATSDNLANILGPAVSGFLISALGLSLAFGLNAIAFALGGTIMWRMQQRTPLAQAQETGQARESLGQALMTGVRFAWHTPAIRTSLLILAMLNFAALGPVVVGLAAMTEQHFGGDASLYGVLMATFGGGALLGGILGGLLPALERPRLVLVWLALGMGGGLIVIGVVEALWVTFAVLALSGVGAGIVGVIAGSWLQARTPDHLQGRMASLLIFSLVAVDPFSNALAGVLLDLSLPAVFIAGGALMIGTGLVALFSPKMG